MGEGTEGELDRNLSPMILLSSSHVTPDSNHSPIVHPASDQRQVQASRAQIGQFALLISPHQVLTVSVESGRKVKSEATGSQATNAQLVISSPHKEEWNVLRADKQIRGSGGLGECLFYSWSQTS